MDDRAVSPVIGVILMVAITVILAAVIGSFVLDLGQSAGQSAPQASLSVSTSASANETTIEHKGGDAIDQSQTWIIIERGDGTSVTFDEATTSDTLAVGGSATFNTSGPSHVSGDLSGMTSSSSSYTFDSGTQITVTLIDTASQRQIFETTVTA